MFLLNLASIKKKGSNPFFREEKQGFKIYYFLKCRIMNESLRNLRLKFEEQKKTIDSILSSNHVEKKDSENSEVELKLKYSAEFQNESKFWF